MEEVAGNREMLLKEELLASREELNAVGLEMQQVQDGLENMKVRFEEQVDDRIRALKESEARFRNMIHQAPVAMLVLRGENLVVAETNAKMLELAGKTEDVLGKTLLDAMPEVRDQPIYEIIRQVYRSGEPFEGLEIPVERNLQGELTLGYFNIIYTPMIENKKITGVLEVAIDVTEHVQARQNLEKIITEKSRLENTLRYSEQRLQSILDTMAEGLAIVDTSGQIIYANKMAEKILELKQSEITNRNFVDSRWNYLRIDGSELPLDELPVAQMLQTGKTVYDQEIALQRQKDADPVYVSINAAPIFEEGRLIGGIATFMDVTHRRKLFQHKDEFISVASHELKTPVTSLKASIQLLHRMKDNPVPAVMSGLIDQSVKSLDKLTGLINDLLNTTRSAQGQLPLQKTVFALADMVNNCCSHLRSLETHKITLEGDLQLRVCADEQRMDQVMVNLINNAVKYAPEAKNIRVLIENTGDFARVSVVDQGPGVPPEKIDHLFDRYYRVADDHLVSGLGLGLYISSEIVKRHGGEIGVNSRIGEGSTFWFTLPLEIS